LTRVSQARQLSPHEAGQGYLVHFRGVVTYCDREAELLFIQDSTAGIFVNPAGMRVEGPEGAEPGASPFSIQPGDWVDVEGRSGLVAYAPEIVQATVKVLGSAPMPLPRVVDLEHLTSGKEDSQWVEVQGIVCSAREQPANIYAAQPWEEPLNTNPNLTTG